MSFDWQQQLRFYWVAESRDVSILITDYKGQYACEWVGNSGRLVITPLTDRCYITLTMALRLMLGGAPAGPAGTGKTETVKDLARACALACYVFNCSPQMNYQTLGNIFKGLSQTGAWGCFDEFNRISIEVLSVVATQVKQVLDAIVKYANPANREDRYKSLPAGRPNAIIGHFELAGDLITLIPTNGIFITMNPGYAGRTELPENIKALFRSCAMIRPDLALICENMLMSEGFGNARVLSVKFTALYQLCSELLSPQNHYDWGLRAVKSVLRVAGGLKRADPDVEEDGVLMRALRDFNTPKMPSQDLPIFLRLIQDMFPFHHHLGTKFDDDLQKLAVQSCLENKLQPETGFVHKVVQLQELLDVRHSVMLLGPAGCAKTSIWKMLAASHNLGKSKKVCVTEIVNPKAVPLAELYGYMTLAKEWKDGVVSIIMRGMSKNYKELGFSENQTGKWIVFDGDIDTLWIESMNTVMDDNKTLTLVSNERIPLSRSMRLLFEINSVENASPATVSRAGMLYINDTDIGWRPFVESWMVAKLADENVKTLLPGLFDKYIDSLYEQMRKAYKHVTRINLINMVFTVCRLLEGYLDTTATLSADVVEAIFAQCVMWGFGGALIIDKNADHRRNFNDIFTAMTGAIKFPKESKESLCFDYYLDVANGEFRPWTTKVWQLTSVCPVSCFVSAPPQTLRSVRYVLPALLMLRLRLSTFVVFCRSLRSCPCPSAPVPVTPCSTTSLSKRSTRCACLTYLPSCTPVTTPSCSSVWPARARLPS
jgi:dynein heavy chain